MAITFCPQCHLPATSDESRSGICPSCGAALSVQAPVVAESEPAPPPPPRPRSYSIGFLLLGAALLIFLAGGAGGFWLHSFGFAPTGDQPSVPANSVAQ